MKQLKLETKSSSRRRQQQQQQSVGEIQQVIKTCLNHFDG